MPEEIRDYPSHIQQETQKEDSKQFRFEIRESIKQCSRHLARGNPEDYRNVALICRDILIPGLLSEEKGIDHFHGLVKQNSKWDYPSLDEFIERGESIAKTFENGHFHDPKPTRDLTLELQGFQTERDVAKGKVESAFRSLVALAEYQGIVEREMRNFAVAYGHSTRIGKLWKRFDWGIGDEIKIVYQGNAQWPKTLFIGGTGSGKSASMGTEIFDRFNSGYKVIDLVDTDEFENAVYDIPQRNGTIDPDSDSLRELREKRGLPADFEDSDDLKNPEIEILVPLSHNINKQKWPFDGDSARVTPFTIPASRIDKQTFISFLAAMLSMQQEVSIRTAYKELNQTGEDWSLRDLAIEIAERDDMDRSYRKRIVNLLSSLQSDSFIRTEESDHMIDWGRIFKDNDTITVFSVAHLNSRNRKLMVMAYLIRSLYEIRKYFNDLPPLAAVFREMHEIVPHRNEKLNDRRGEELQDAIASNLSYILRKNRHENIEILADTQDLMDLKKGVRKRFNRYVCFKLPDDSLKKAFEYAGESKYKTAKNSIGVEAGTGAVVGLTKPNIQKGIPFLSPLDYAPSPMHTMHSDEESTGFQARERYLNENLKRGDWTIEMPERLRFDASKIMVEAEGELAENKPVKVFVNQFVDDNPDDEKYNQQTPYVHTATMRQTYNNWADHVGVEIIESATSFGMRFKPHVDCRNERRKGKSAYVGCRLNDDANQFVP